VNADEVGAELVRAAGGYLRNVVKEPRVTCRVCTTPVQGFDRCWRCQQHGRIAGLADVVAPLTYAIDNTQSATLLRHYKDDPVRTVRERHSLIINWLLYLGITLHERCIAAAARRPVSLRMVIPSLTGRAGRHPLTDIAHAMNALSGAVALVPAPDAMCDRAVNDKFVLHPDTRLDGQHVLILDDTWTTGSNAQSAALAVRRAGAVAVSVMVIARWLSPGYGATAEFIKTRLQRDYDPSRCPVTGASCP
jgi:hypoxanthine-guanine phosphoribosyltransferase